MHIIWFVTSEFTLAYMFWGNFLDVVHFRLKEVRVWKKRVIPRIWDITWLRLALIFFLGAPYFTIAGHTNWYLYFWVGQSYTPVIQAMPQGWPYDTSHKTILAEFIYVCVYASFMHLDRGLPPVNILPCNKSSYASPVTVVVVLPRILFIFFTKQKSLLGFDLCCASTHGQSLAATHGPEFGLCFKTKVRSLDEQNTGWLKFQGENFLKYFFKVCVF